MSMNTEVAYEINTAVEDQNVSLLGVHIDSHIVGLVERTTVSQTFRNDELEAIEVTYTFPLPADATVCGFEIITANRVLTGTAQERDAAVQAYDEAITGGDGAFMLESHRDDVFTVNVGNIEPGQLAVLQIQYVRLLPQMDGEISLHFPATVPDRYVSLLGVDNPEAAGVDARMINPPRLLNNQAVPYGLVLDVTLDSALAVSGINSETHDLIVTHSDSRIRLAEGQVDMSRDVVIDITLEASDAPTSLVESWGDSYYAAVFFLPDFSALEQDQALFSESPVTSEVVFVLDCSGSMAGSSMSQATRALELCLRSLKEGDLFNIVRFGSSHEPFKKKLVRYSEKSLIAAVNWLRQCSANLGGTELLRPLEDVFSWESSNADGIMDVVLLTDGHVSNEVAVHRLASQHQATHRVFTFGIGAGAGRSLLNGLADATYGAAEYISVNEPVEEKVLRTFCRIASPKLTNMSLEAPTGLKLRLPSDRMPPLFDSDAVCLLASISGELQGEIELTLTAHYGQQKLSWPVPLNAPSALTSISESTVAVAWARERIRGLEVKLDAYSGLMDAPWEGKAPDRNQERIKKQLLKLATEFNILCDHTAFVALEHRSVEDRNEGLPAQREIPVLELAGNTNDLSEFDFNSLGDSDVCDNTLKPAHAIRQGEPSGTRALSIGGSAYQNYSQDMEMIDIPAFLRRKADDPEEKQDSLEGALFSLLQKQDSSGSFSSWSAESSSFETYAEKLQTHNYDIFDEVVLKAPEMLHTLYALHCFYSMFKEDKGLWKLAEVKARKYLTSEGLDDGVIDQATRIESESISMV